MKVADRNYTGKEVFVGIDVHKKTYAIAVSCDRVLVKKWTSKASPEELVSQLSKFFKGASIYTAYEAGFSGFRLHRVLEAAGFNSRVVNAGSIEVASNDRVKTDNRDAKKIAEQLEAGRLGGIYVPSENEESKRSLSRGREQVVERRKSIGNQLKMKLHYLGIELPAGKQVSESFMRWVEALDLAKDHDFTIKELIDAWRQETKRIKRFDKALRSQAEEDELEEIYRSAPGVGATTSRILSNELGDMSRFSNEAQLFSNSGLTPSEYSSGDSIRKGHISRQGSPRIRAILTEVAWRAIKKDSSLCSFYQRVSSTRGSKRAIVAVARKILGRLRSCLINRVIWQDMPLV